jgi:hypothetical protein
MTVMEMHASAWHVSFGDGVADSDEASVAFTHDEGQVRVYRIVPKRGDVDERWAERIADDAAAAIASAWRVGTGNASRVGHA